MYDIFSQEYPREKNDEIIPIVAFKGCNETSMGAKQVCKNINWTYYNRDGSSKIDGSIQLHCADGSLHLFKNKEIFKLLFRN